MQAVKRPYAIAAAALAATSLVAATPQLSRLADLPSRSMETRLVDSSISTFRSTCSRTSSMSRTTRFKPSTRWRTRSSSPGTGLW